MSDSEAVKSIADFSDIPEVSRIEVLKTLPSGEIRIETGADGAYLLFDCDCLDALPYCKAQCCALIGTVVFPQEAQSYPDDWVEVDRRLQSLVMKRDADGYCHCLDRRTRRCGIYEDRPQTCENFHCTRGATQRGWKLANHVDRLPE